ncbi:MAG: ATP-binding cassette domain-containing protein [Treponema sp.]|jgi:oligopeptide transport system ATP-binding protein|nr:ATP-binding cassette domain-containing protein [Treponema sp.]
MGDLLEVHFLSKSFKAAGLDRQAKYLKAVDDVSFSIGKGMTFGLVGESGCGKSTIGKIITRLVEPTGGLILFEGLNVLNLKSMDLKQYRKDVQMIFQDPYASLNPRFTIESIIAEPLRIHHIGSRKEQRRKVKELLEIVGLNPDYGARYPHEFSGGQRQRIGIARALALEPRLIICDEPVSALDVSIQAQIISLLEKLQKELGIAYLFISHDLNVVKHISEYVAVMYLGRIVERSGWYSLYQDCRHPYTRSLLSAVPIPDPLVQKKRGRILLEGDPPSPLDPPWGCGFHTRCPAVQEKCRREKPPEEKIGPGHFCSCHFAGPSLPGEAGSSLSAAVL